MRTTLTIDDDLAAILKRESKRRGVSYKELVARLQRNLEFLRAAGNLTTDAHLATLPMERGYLLCSTEVDFARFPDLKWTNPLLRSGSGR